MVSSFTFGASRLAYHSWGSGPAVLLCFHGIGQDGRAFEPFGTALASTFTIYSFDLFYHGQSSGLNGATYEPNEVLMADHWQHILSEFLREKGIQRFSVAGFSMGGVFALATAQGFAARLDALWLLAPDGITTSPWYAFATGSSFGRWLFRYVLRHLPLFRNLSNGLVRLGWLDRSLVRFAQSTLATPAQRERVSRSWIGFRPLRPRLDELAATLNSHPIRVRLFLGEFDRVLPREAVLPLIQRVPTCEETILPVGHNRLIEVVAHRIAR